MSGRKLNVLEQKIHQAALSAPQTTIASSDLDKLSSDPSARTAALNFLLGAGLLKVLKDAKGATLFRAVGKKEMEVKKDLGGEEAMILSHIQAAGNEGIWTKHIKAKTELHQTVVDRCLKSLAQKQLIKSVKSVKQPTRKIYMLYHLEPSVELTGGPWYTDNELDTEFIKLLCSACLRFIKDRSFPKHKRSVEISPYSQPLFPISNAPPYPSDAQVQSFLSKSKITETSLNIEHVEMLLNVLVLDGEVEKLPAFGGALWDNTVEEASDTESEDGRSTKRKRKHRSKEDDSSRKRKRRRKEREASSESGSESDSDIKKSKKRKKSGASDSSDESSQSEVDRKKSKKRDRKKRKVDGSEDSDDSDDDGTRGKGRGKSKSKGKGKSKEKKKKSSRKSKKAESSSESESSSDSGSDSESNSSDTDADEEAHSSRSKAKLRSSKARSRSRSRSRSKSKKRRASSPGVDVEEGDEFGGGGAYVYRAIKPERVDLGLSQAPCGRCPTFEFCKEGGPVNSSECTYYGEWVGQKTVKVE